MRVYKTGGKRQLSQSKTSKIRNRQSAPIESLLRRMAARKELKKGESEGDNIVDLGDVDFGDGTQGESCQVVDGKIQCASYDTSSEDLGEMATEDEKGDRKPFSLAIADSIKGFRDARQKGLKNRMKRVGRRRELDLAPFDRSRVIEVRNPIARARYKSLQRRLARSQGREDAGGNIYLGSFEF